MSLTIKSSIAILGVSPQRCYCLASDRASPVPQVPRLPRKTKIDVTKRHACHLKRRWMSPSDQVPRLPGGWRQVPRLPRKVPLRHRRPKRAQARDQCQPTAASSTPATQNEGRCHQEMVCDKVVCERWCVTKLCMKDGG